MEKLQISDEWNGYPEIFSLSRPLEIFRQYLLLRIVFFKRKNVVRCPCVIRVVGFFYVTRISAGKTTSYMLKTKPERNLCERGNLNPRVHSYLLLSLALWVEWNGPLEMRLRAGYHITLKLYVQ